MAEVDRLEVVIQSDIDKVNRELDSLIKRLGTVASGLDAIRNNKGLGDFAQQAKIVSENMANMSKSIQQSMRNVNFEGVSKSANVMSNEVKKSADALAKSWGIKGKNAISEVESKFGEYINYAVSGSDKADDAWKSLSSTIRSNAKVIDDSKESYRSLLDYVKQTNAAAKNGNGISLGFKPSEFQGDFAKMRAIAGNAFSTKGGGTDFETYIKELNDQLGNIIPVGNTAADTFSNFVNVLQNARTNTMSYADAVKSGKIAYDDADNSILDFVNNVYKMEKAARQAAQGVRETTKQVADIQPKAEATAKSFDEIASKYKDLGKGFKFTGNAEEIRNQIDKYANSLENAKLKKQELEASGKTDTSSYENAVRDVMKYSNVIDSLKKQLADIANPKVDNAFSQSLIEKFKEMEAQEKEYLNSVKNGTKEVDEEVQKVSKSMSKGFVPPKQTTSDLDAIRERIDYLDSKFKDVGKGFTFSGNAKELQAEIERTEKALDRLYSKQDKQIDLGQYTGKGFEATIRDINEMQNRLEILRQQQAQLPPLRIDTRSINEGLDNVKSKMSTLKEMLAKWKIIVPTSDMKKLQNDIDKVKQKYADLINYIAQKNSEDVGFGNTSEFRQKQIEAEALRNEYDRLIQKQNEMSRMGGKGFTFDAKAIKKNFDIVYNALQKCNKAIDSFAKKMISLITPTNTAKSAMDGLKQVSDRLVKSITRVGTMFRTMVTRMAIRAVIDGLKNGFLSLAVYSDEFRVSITNLKSALATLGNSIAAAASPLINALAPAIITLINWLTTAVNVINQFISAFTGKQTWIKAQKVVGGMGDAASGAGSKAKKAAKDVDKLMKSIRQFDELKVINLPDENDTDNGGGGGGGGGVTTGQYETLPIDEKIKEAAEKAKDILRQLFAPMKEAWNREGMFVINSWKNALSEVWKLIKDIGSDFLKVWQEEKTIKIFQNILHVFGDVGLVVANLASNFRKAWNENDNGFKILRGIRDVIYTIVKYIRMAADYTVKWSKDLDFSPLLSKISEYLTSLQPVIKAVSGLMYDFYTKVILPLGKWVLEKGLPNLVQVFIDFNNKVKWDELRNKLDVFMDKLEPFAETIGEGLIIFINRLMDALANFLNGEKFQKFLTNLGNWMASKSPEDIANGIEKIIKAIIALKIALLAFTAIKGIVAVGTTLKAFGTLVVQFAITISKIPGIIAGIPTAIGNAIALIKPALAAVLTTLKAGMTAIGTFLSTYGATILATLGWIAAGIAAAIAGWKIGEWISEKLGGETFDMGFLEQLEYIKDSFTDGSWKAALDAWGKDLADGWKDIGQEAKNLGKWLWDGLWEGINNAFAPMNDWIFEHITEPFIDGIKNFFGIHSPSTVMAEIGGFLIEGLKQGIENAWKSFSSAWQKKKEDIVNTFKDAKAKFVAKGKEIITGIKSGISTLWGDFIGFWIAKKTEIVTKFNDILQLFMAKGRDIVEGIKAGIVNAWTTFISFLTTKKNEIVNAFGNLKSSLESKGKEIISGIEQGIKKAWGGLTTFLAEKKSAIVDAFSGFVTLLETKGREIITGITNGINNAFNSLKTAISTLKNNLVNMFNSKDFLSIGTKIVDGMLEGIKNAWNKLTGWIGTSVKKLKEAVTGGGDSNSGGRVNADKKGGFVNPKPMKSYAWGGYTPRSYSLFMAGENGIPEILGTVGGRNAVAGGREITGIRDAVNANGAAEAQLLANAVSLLRVIADKDFGITQNDLGRSVQLYSREFEKRTGRPAF